MMTKNLTKLINQRINRLQTDINDIRPGGGLEVLRDFLVMYQGRIQAFVYLIDQLNGEDITAPGFCLHNQNSLDRSGSLFPAVPKWSRGVKKVKSCKEKR